MIRYTLLTIFAFLFIQTHSASAQIDALWAELSQTVEKGDFEGYAALYHEEAVLVNAISGSSYPISVALEGWKQGFEDTKAGKMSASVEFKFTQRIHSDSTAHDTGMFLYTSQMEGEEANPIYVYFEALMVSVNGEWKILMEYQKSMATREEWDAI